MSGGRASAPGSSFAPYLSVSLVLAALLSGCSPALRGSRPGPGLAADLGLDADPGPAAEAGALLATAGEAFSRRPDVGAVKEAARTFGRAALADEKGIDGLLGFARATAWLVERERDGAARERLATAAVRAGEWCLARSPGNPACDYALAIAVGQQTRERPSTAIDGVRQMQAALSRAIAGDERQDGAGPRRVLALLYLRAPGWPSGPGDPEAGLLEARRAVALFPDHPWNQLVLGEALEKTEDAAGAADAYRRALTLALSRSASGDPDSADWAEQARKALSRLGVE